MCSIQLLPLFDWQIKNSGIHSDSVSHKVVLLVGASSGAELRSYTDLDEERGMPVEALPYQGGAVGLLQVCTSSINSTSLVALCCRPDHAGLVGNTILGAAIVTAD